MRFTGLRVAAPSLPCYLCDACGRRALASVLVSRHISLINLCLCSGVVVVGGARGCRVLRGGGRSERVREIFDAPFTPQVVVKFDGMGPTWTELVQKGLELYPQASHGILSDADFTPETKFLDKRQLKRECSKHMYKIKSPDGGTVRNMDWIYRNIPGAKVERRTHQSLNVPAIPGQTVYQTLIDIVVQEHEGGYQDRTGNKSATYLHWLHKDLEEMPGDPRTIYYLGHAHIEQIGPTPAKDVRHGGPGAYHVHAMR